MKKVYPKILCLFLISIHFSIFSQETKTQKVTPATKENTKESLVTPVTNSVQNAGTGTDGTTPQDPNGTPIGTPIIPVIDPNKPVEVNTQAIIGSANNANQSPTASAEVNFANRFQDIPVNLFTGTPQIALPIYTLSEGNLSVPITIGYNASGMKAHELASWSGLNWSLSASSNMVNRIVRGIPDEGKLEYIALTNYNSTTRKGFFQWGVKADNDAENDPEPDLYFFTVNGMSYKFTWVNDANGTPQAVFFPDADIKVSVTYENIKPLGENNINYNIGRFKNWKFIMPDGTIYLFATRGYADTEASFEVEAKTAYNNGIYTGGSELTRYIKNNQVTSAWYLTQMASSYGHQIDFYYKQSQYSFFKLAEQEIQTNNCNLSGLVKNVNRVFINGATLSLIESKNIQVEFNKGVTTCYTDTDIESPTYGQELCYVDDSQIPQRADIDTWSQTPSFSSGAKLLANIVVHDKGDDTNKLTWTFNYSYFNSGGVYGTEPYFYPLSDIQTYLKSSYRFRLKLDKITLPDNNNYQFDYYGGSFDIPSRMTNGVDHWGFMNGAAGGVNGNLIGHDEYRNCTVIPSSTRSATAGWSQYGTIQKIRSSIGSETSLTYENHTAYNYLDDSNVSKLVGGNRVTEIRNKDLISGIETLKKYDYTDINGTTSGFMVLKPIYHWYAYPSTTEYINAGLYGMLLSETGRPAVGYNRVTEKIVEYTGIANNNLGSTVTEFDQLLQEVNVFDGATSYIRPYRSFVPFHEYRVGSPKKVSVKNSSGQTLSEKEYTYSTVSTTIPNLSAYRSFRLNNINYNFQRNYTEAFSKYRLSSEISRAYSQNGTNPVQTTTTYTYKDEMDNTYQTNYAGKHNQVVKTTTTDSYGYSIVSQNKIVADFNFGTDYTTTCYDENNIQIDCNDANVIYAITTSSPHEPTNAEAKGIFQAQQKHILYAPVESFTTKNGNLIGAYYQTYYGDSTATHKYALAKQTYTLENIPKARSSFTEILYTPSTEAFPKDAAYDLKGTNEEYNTLGFPTKTSVKYGSVSKTDYDANGVLPIKSYSNLGEYSERSQLMTYNPIIFGVKSQTGANGLVLNNEYYPDGKLKQQTDKDGNVLKHIEYVYKGKNDIDSKVSTDTTYNRIITRVPRIATTDATALDYQDCMISIQYMDGGRVMQNVDYKASPNAKDMISGIVIYDTYGRPLKSYLPMESTKADGSYTSPATVLTNAIAFYNDQNPFTEIRQYEASPMSRVLSAYGTGKSWRDNNKYSESKFETGTGIKKMTVAYNSNAVTVGTYSTYELSKNTSIDERGSSVIVYTDKSGNTIQREVQVDATNYLITSYIYDNAGRLRFILTPKAYNALGATTSITNMETWGEFNENMYAYHYDGRGKIIEKKSPGIGWSRVVYNRLNQAVMSQDDDELAKNNTWNYAHTDGQGRGVRTGQVQLPSNYNRATLQTLFDNFTDTKQFEERTPTSGIGRQYTNRSFPTTLQSYITDTSLKTVHFFDDYLWRYDDAYSGTIADYAFQSNPFNASAYSATNAKGLATGGLTKIEMYGDFLFPFVSYFDDKNRTIQSTNYQNLLARNQSDVKYNFIGEVLQSQMIYRKSGDLDRIISKENILDNVGRTKDFYYALKEGTTYKVPRLKMFSLFYDNIGQLSAKLIEPKANAISSSQSGDWTLASTWLNNTVPTLTTPAIINQGHIVTIPANTTVQAGTLYDAGTLKFLTQSKLQLGTLAPVGNAGLQSIGYSYNVRGQMRGVNLDASGNVSTSNDRLFSYKIDYHEDGRYFDGSISKQTWKANNSPTIRTYTHTYDNANRLTNSSYTGASAENYAVSQDYDVNGNLQHLQRYGKTGANTYGLVDNLTYSYLSNGNKLQKVDDAINGNIQANDFRDVAGNDYTFSVDGKMTADANKGITSIEYNFLDLVKKITFNNNRSVEYWYTSTGTRRQRKVSNNGNDTYTLYDGEIVYSYTGTNPALNNFGISEIQNPEGRWVAGKFEYGYTDHVGNLRLSYKDSLGTAFVTQSQSYDPWSNVNAGSEYQLVSNQKDRYLVSGKETDSESGNILLDWRDYDSVTGRMNSFDPASTEGGQISISPFAYGWNRPSMLNDPDGRCPMCIGFMVGIFTSAIGDLASGRQSANIGEFLMPGIRGAIGGGISSVIGGAFAGMGSFAGKGLLQAGVHALSGGLQSAAFGGDFWQGAASNGISSGFASGADALGLGGVGQLLGGGLSGGVASSLFGGSFWDGARDGLIVSGLNHLSQHQQTEPWDTDGDGKLSKIEADIWWMHGGGKGIIVDNSKIDWKGLEIPKDLKNGQGFNLSTTDAFKNVPFETAATYGGTYFTKINNTTAKISDQDYHYNRRSWTSKENFLRNIATDFGTPVQRFIHTPNGTISINAQGQTFNIHFKNPIFKVR